MKPSELRTLADFYAYYESIPGRYWTKGSWISPEDSACRCAVGHLGPAKGNSGWYPSDNKYSGSAIHRLEQLLGVSFLELSNVSEGAAMHYGCEEFPASIYKPRTPKSRILGYLRWAMRRAAKGIKRPGAMT